MAIFTNQATLSYAGGTALSNVVVGEIQERVALTKTAVEETYRAGGDNTFIISMVNNTGRDLTNLTLRDNLGEYSGACARRTPQSYKAGSVRYYVNGILQAAPEVSVSSHLSFSGISVPANGNSMIAYAVHYNDYAPCGTGASITNTVTLSGGGIGTPITAEETVTADSAPQLSIEKTLFPSVMEENDRVTYTFMIRNSGTRAATAQDDVEVHDTFDPVLNNISVRLNGTTLPAGQYSYNAFTGVFSTDEGVITVPAAEVRSGDDGRFSTVPGTTVLTVTGTV